MDECLNPYQTHQTEGLSSSDLSVPASTCLFNMLLLVGLRGKLFQDVFSDSSATFVINETHIWTPTSCLFLHLVKTE